MIVRWSDNAQSHWFETANYIKNDFGLSALDDFAKQTTKIVKMLSVMPLSGPFEQLLSHRNGSYRSIIFGKYSKLVYIVQDDTITIVDYWDTRQEPKQLANRL